MPVMANTKYLCIRRKPNYTFSNNKYFFSLPFSVCVHWCGFLVFVWGFVVVVVTVVFPLLLWETRMEVFRQNDSKLSCILPCQQLVIGTKDHSRLFTCAEAQQAEENRGPLLSLLPSPPAQALPCMLHFLVPWGSFTVVVLFWQMCLRLNLAYLVFGSRDTTTLLWTCCSFWGNCNVFQLGCHMADLDCCPKAMALSQELKFPRTKYWICFRECSLIEMTYMSVFLSSPPWVFSAFLSHLSKKLHIISTFTTVFAKK